MELKDGKGTMFFRDDGLTIELRDGKSGITFAKAKFNPKQTMQILSGIAYTPCSLIVTGLDKVGLSMEHKKLTFKMPEKVSWRDRERPFV